MDTSPTLGCILSHSLPPLSPLSPSFPLLPSPSSPSHQQATLSDKAVGTLMILISLLVFIYYTVWVIVLVSSGLLPHLKQPPSRHNIHYIDFKLLLNSPILFIKYFWGEDCSRRGNPLALMKQLIPPQSIEIMFI